MYVNCESIKKIGSKNIIVKEDDNKNFFWFLTWTILLLW